MAVENADVYLDVLAAFLDPAIVFALFGLVYVLFLCSVMKQTQKMYRHAR